MTVRRHRGAGALPALLALAFALSVGLGAGASWQEVGPDGLRKGPMQPRAQGSGSATERRQALSERWHEVDELEDADRVAAALERVEEILAAAIREHDEEEWTRALIRAVQLRTALHGYETAVSFLQKTAWPEEAVWRSVVNLFYAQSLVTYLRVFSWEIGQREPVETSDDLDLKAWTQDQIVTEAHRAYAEAWRTRTTWGDRGLGALAEYLQQNTYPARIRGTLRDTVTYLWVELLADSSWWRPSHGNQVYGLDRGALIAGEPSASKTVELTDPAVHPFIRLGAVLDDLEHWHRLGGRPEAAFEARLERLRRLQGELVRPDDRLAIRANLEAHLEALGRRYEWWSEGQAQLAELVRQEASGDALIRARKIALAGSRAHPDSVGGRHCRHLAAVIEAPEFSLTAMQIDGPGRRSILVKHRNLRQLYFRAYRVDLLEQIAASRDYSLLPDFRQVSEILQRKPPDLEWSVELPPTPDYRTHQTFVTPTMKSPGLYLVQASATDGFRESGNRMAAVNMLIGDLVLISRQGLDELEVVVRSGESGRPLEGVEVLLYRFDYRQGHQRIAGQTTDSDGTARFRSRWKRRDRHFLVARKGDDLTLDSQTLARFEAFESRSGKAALVYTDRSVYRPLQHLQWKVVAYSGGGQEARYRVLASEQVTVELVDPNQEVVASRSVDTNSHGSASGEFEIPVGRLLGTWFLRTSLGGGAAIRVEEYKRPTFEATILEPESALRLNRPAELVGEARYYFGLPVVKGAVSWQVRRVPTYPRWWSTFGPGRPIGAPEVVATGETETDDAGGFRVAFLPTADEREAEVPGISYSFRLSVEITDLGGETHSVERDFRLGFVAVRTAIDSQQSFFTTEEPIVFQLHRSDLDGSPRAGPGEWRVHALRQPETALLPADQPVPGVSDDWQRFATPGDSLRPRWDPGYDPRQVLRSWQAGPALLQGEASHDGEGRADIVMPSLPPGAYRLSYSTEDEFGAGFETFQEFVVAIDGDVPLALPALLLVDRSTVSVGGTLRMLVHSGLVDQQMVVELFRDEQRFEHHILESEAGGRILHLPVEARFRGGLAIRLTVLRDHQLMTITESVYVPWEDRELKLSFANFRDLLEPGQRETWRIEVASSDGKLLGEGAAEVLAYMYDRSLDFFAVHQPPRVQTLYPVRGRTGPLRATLGAAHEIWSREKGFRRVPDYPRLIADRLKFFDGYGIGGPGVRSLSAQGRVVASESPSRLEEVVATAPPGREEALPESAAPPAEPEGRRGVPQPSQALRADFSETAFWEPHLLVGRDGSAVFEFNVPDSVTEWNVWLHALTRDLRGGSVHHKTRTVKELMVRPYLPRFLREGDRALLKVVVNSAAEEKMEGTLDFEIRDPETGESLLAEFGLSEDRSRAVPFQLAGGGSTSLSFEVLAPQRVGRIAVEARARAGAWTDGERRPLPLLPGRLQLAQSRFAALRNADRRSLHFADLATSEDPSRRNQQLVVTLDAQLFYGVLGALPYLATFPYECTEQILNRFLSAAIVSSLYDHYPAVARMAHEQSRRDTRFEPWDRTDPNRKMELEETPWLEVARGATSKDDELANLLDPRVAEAERRVGLAKLQQAQTALGGFPWWPGGPPSAHMTLYLLHSFSRALEFGVEIPRSMVVEAWKYMHRHFLDEIAASLVRDECCWEMVTFLNYVLSSYPDTSWTGGVFEAGERAEMLTFSFEHWRRHSPLLKSYLALTLARAGRAEDARMVFESVMDSSITTRDEGTFWTPEDRAWLWYNDTIESHAFALRSLLEITPGDERRHGLVHWLFLNKKLNHWKSTRATAEVIYSLVHYLEREGGVAQREAALVEVGQRRQSFVFEPEAYSGKRNRVVLEADEIGPSTATVLVSKETPGLMFASATWHFSTEQPPAESRGDFLAVERRYFRRLPTEEGWKLQPLADGRRLAIGDQVEVHLSLRARHAAEYVHLRDPRAAGLEPLVHTSGYSWGLGIGWYEETRDSGANFFFERLPVGEYTLKYRLRAAVAGTFRVAPALLQSMYAPEFTGYSAAAALSIEP